MSYFSTSDIISSASTALEKANNEISGMSNASLFNEGVAKEICRVISNGKPLAHHWKAMYPKSQHFDHIETFPRAFLDRMDKELLASLEEKDIHIYRGDMNTALIKVIYRWEILNETQT